MRIISGIYRGRKIPVAKGLPARPTTDRCKESLFNILQNRLDFEGISVLDLFCGTGNIGLECLSRGAAHLVSIDKHRGSVRAFQRIIAEWKPEAQCEVRAMDALRFMKTSSEKFDFIFMDPPYHLERQESLIDAVWEHKLLEPDGILVLEHISTKDVSTWQGFVECRKYGDSSLSFFE